MWQHLIQGWWQSASDEPPGRDHFHQLVRLASVVNKEIKNMMITKENIMSEAARAMMSTWVERSFCGRSSMTATTTRLENRLTTTGGRGR